MEPRVALITGASSGFGRDTALALAAEGFIVYGAARRLALMQDLTMHGIRILPLDVTDEASLNSCVNTILTEQGRIDVLVNNAGYGSLGALEEVPLSEARRQFDVNVFGLVRLVQLVLPTMRQQGSGRILNVASIAGHFCVPFGAWYSASKFALEALSDGMRYELAPFGIDVVVIEPGIIKTGWDEIALTKLREVSGQGVYAKEAIRVADGMAAMYQSRRLSNSLAVARIICEAVKAPRPKTRYLVGRGARLLVTLHTLLPTRCYDRLTRWMMGLRIL